MWIDHFLMKEQMTAVNAQKIGRLTHFEITALMSARKQAIDASIRRKLKKIKEHEEAEIKKESAIFEMFM
jgi:chromatin remodeling complex protein RSC6